MKVITRIRAFFLKKEADKEVLDRKRFIGAVALSLGVGTLFVLFSNSNGDSSVVLIANAPLAADNLDETQASAPISPKVSGLLQASEQRVIPKSPPKPPQRPRAKPTVTHTVLEIKYRAPQVIERQGGNLNSNLPIGSNLVGKLLTSIDTRENEQLAKVVLPYGGKGKRGVEGLPKNTVLFGSINYPNRGKKVFMRFTKALLPDGKETVLLAQALNTKDYSPGLEGKFHSGATSRIAATLGLTMVSAFTDTLTEKQVLGSEGVVTPKATLKNALYQGISKASAAEAPRQAEELSKAQAYVTVSAGREIIVNLLATYRGER